MDIGFRNRQSQTECCCDPRLKLPERGAARFCESGSNCVRETRLGSGTGSCVRFREIPYEFRVGVGPPIGSHMRCGFPSVTLAGVERDRRDPVVLDRTRLVSVMLRGLLCAMATDLRDFGQIMTISRAGHDSLDVDAHAMVAQQMPFEVGLDVASAATFSQPDEPFAHVFSGQPFGSDALFVHRVFPDDLFLACGLHGYVKSGWQEGSAS